MQWCLVVWAWFCGGACLGWGAPMVVWPTPNAAWLEGRPIEAFVQATVSGDPISGLFGCVRNSGARFHEGLDLAATRHDARGEALDHVFAALEGEVVHVNTVENRSSYGLYIVLEHDAPHLQFYTLYSHLADVAPGIETGVLVPAGAPLGRMGRSAGGYSIPPERAHLHFEIGLRLSQSFQQWYDAQGFDAPNWHGNYNGMNLSGVDPLAFFEAWRAGRVESDIAGYFRNLEPAATLRIASRRLPEMAAWAPALFDRPPSGTRPQGWEITFTGYGLPMRFRGLVATPRVPLEVVTYDQAALDRYGCRAPLRRTKTGWQLGRSAAHALELIFGHVPGEGGS